MITINQPKIIATNQNIGEPEIHITGISTDGTRQMLVSFPVTDQDGVRIDTIVKTYDGQDYNDVYSIFNSDKTLISRVFTDENITADTTKLPDNLVNVN